MWKFDKNNTCGAGRCSVQSRGECIIGNVQWRVYIVKFWMHAPLGVQILLISCSFWEILAKSYVSAPLGSWHPLLGEILDPPLKMTNRFKNPIKLALFTNFVCFPWKSVHFGIKIQLFGNYFLKFTLKLTLVKDISFAPS